MVRLAITAITGFSIFPLQLATFVGFIIAVLSGLFIFLVIAARLSGIQAFAGQATTLVMVSFSGWRSAHLSGHHRRVSGTNL